MSQHASHPRHYTAKWFPFSGRRLPPRPVSPCLHHWRGFAVNVAEPATVLEAKQLNVCQENAVWGRTCVLNHTLGCVFVVQTCMHVHMFVPMCVVGTQQQSRAKSSHEAPLELGLETMTLGNVIPPTGWLACDTQSHGSGVHQCTVALWQKPSGVVLCSAAPNPEV